MGALLSVPNVDSAMLLQAWSDTRTPKDHIHATEYGAARSHSENYG
jgi:hypothetical protein